jgi:hypothetical protein
MGTWKSFTNGVRHAFTVGESCDPFSAEDHLLAERLAQFITRRALNSPCILILEMARPLNFVGSQLLTFIRPFATFLFSASEYDRFVRLLERRESVDLLVAKISECERHDRPDPL